MTIAHDSKAYTVAYWWKELLSIHVPVQGEKINGCSFFWHLVAGVTVGPVMVALLYIIMFAFIACAYGLLFWVAKKPADSDIDDAGLTTLDIEWIPSILGHKVWPVSVVIACAAAYGIFLFVVNFFTAILLFFGCVLIAAVLTNAIPWGVVVLYFKAFKERYCPIIEIQ